MIIPSSSNDHSQKKKMSANRAAFRFGKSSFSSWPIIACLSIVLVSWLAKTTIGTATNRGVFISPVFAAYTASAAVAHRPATEYRLLKKPNTQIAGVSLCAEYRLLFAILAKNTNHHFEHARII